MSEVLKKHCMIPGDGWLYARDKKIQAEEMTRNLSLPKNSMGYKEAEILLNQILYSLLNKIDAIGLPFRFMNMLYNRNITKPVYSVESFPKHTLDPFFEAVATELLNIYNQCSTESDKKEIMSRFKESGWLRKSISNVMYKELQFGTMESEQFSNLIFNSVSWDYRERPSTLELLHSILFTPLVRAVNEESRQNENTFSSDFFHPSLHLYVKETMGDDVTSFIPFICNQFCGPVFNYKQMTQYNNVRPVYYFSGEEKLKRINYNSNSIKYLPSLSPEETKELYNFNFLSGRRCIVDASSIFDYSRGKDTSVACVWMLRNGLRTKAIFLFTDKRFMDISVNRIIMEIPNKNGTVDEEYKDKYKEMIRRDVLEKFMSYISGSVVNIVNYTTDSKEAIQRLIPIIEERYPWFIVTE
jgi:hypothetical protein